MLPCLLGMLCAASAHAAVNCTATVANVMFGDVDLVSNIGTSSSGMLSYTCTNNDTRNAVQVNACFLIDGGEGHQNQLNPSDMVDTGNAANQLLFNLYLPNGSTVWTTSSNGLTPYNPPMFTIAAAPSFSSSSYTSTVTMPARLVSGQNLAPKTGANSYRNSYGAGCTSIAWNSSNANRPAPSTCGANRSIRFPFMVSGIGTGSAQPAVTVYGRVRPQTTPSAGDYTDIITVMVMVNY